MGFCVYHVDVVRATGSTHLAVEAAGDRSADEGDVAPHGSWRHLSRIQSG